jgi:hypothetical protein
VSANAGWRELEAHVQEEINGQSRLAALLEAQSRAIRTDDAAGVAASTAAIEAELEALAARSHKRAALLDALARDWCVAAPTLTLSRVIQRAGDHGERLARQRDELARVSSEVTRRARTAAAAARIHRDFAADVVRAWIGSEAGAPAPAGALVDASA